MAAGVLKHVYFGPRDPITGDMMEEPRYEHQNYPRAMYHESGEVEIVNSAEEQAALGSTWADSPAAFGVETHPSAASLKAERMAKIKASDEKRGPGRPPKVA